jgi:hypothetical protein
VASRGGGHLQSLRETFCTAPVLVYLQPAVKFKIDTDASNVRIRGVLLQVQDGKEWVTACYSKMLSKVEGNYCITLRELLAIVRTLEHFHKYCYGQELHMCTDRSTMTWRVSFKNLEGEMAQWVQCFQEYTIMSKYCKGSKHNNADTLS